MDRVDFIQKIEDGEVKYDEAVRECVDLYQATCASILTLRVIFDKLDEPGTVALLGAALDSLDSAVNPHYTIDEDGQIDVREPA